MERYRIVEGVGLYYVTFTVVEWLPVFIDESACKIITDSFSFCITNKHLGVKSDVIMPTHLHAITFDPEFHAERLKHTLNDMRIFTERRLLDHAARHLPTSFTERFQEHAGKDRERRFWQPSQHPVTFGGRKRTICTTIRVARDWFGRPRIGDFHLHGIG